MTLNDKNRDIDLEMAERLLSHPWENSTRKCPSLELPPEPANQPALAQEDEDRWPTGLSSWYLVSPALTLWIFRDEVSWAAVDALSAFRVQVLTWLGFPGVL